MVRLHAETKSVEKSKSFTLDTTAADRIVMHMLICYSCYLLAEKEFTDPGQSHLSLYYTNALWHCISLYCYALSWRSTSYSSVSACVGVG